MTDQSTTVAMNALTPAPRVRIAAATRHGDYYLVAYSRPGPRPFGGAASGRTAEAAHAAAVEVVQAALAREGGNAAR